MVQRLEDSANIFAIRCAETSLADEVGHAMAVKRNAADRDEFMKQVAARKLQAIPSAANFVMMNANRPVRTVIEFFRQNNVRIGRPFPPMDTYVRVSLGKPEEMKEFWRVWDKL
jgi:histidinol-phosphate aminotransferase